MWLSLLNMLQTFAVPFLRSTSSYMLSFNHPTSQPSDKRSQKLGRIDERSSWHICISLGLVSLISRLLALPLVITVCGLFVVRVILAYVVVLGAACCNGV